MHGLGDLRVVDFSSHIAGPYCTKLLADAGADVVKVEGPEGDPLRRWSATGADLAGEDSALFRFLNASKRSVVGRPGDPEIVELIADADLVVEDLAADVIDAAELTARLPRLTLLSITPYGRTGPWAQRPATEFIVQAESGSIGSRGLPGQEPFQAGGRITEWIGGTFGAVAALAAVQRARRSSRGEIVDFSLLEVMNYASSNFIELAFRLLGVRLEGPAQSVETPSIEPTADGYVGFCTNTAQQFSDFLLLIERPDLREDKALFQVHGRMQRFGEWNEIVHAHTTRHSTQDLIDRASLLRIPVAPVNNGETVRNHEQLAAREVFWKDPSGCFLQPRPPYRIDDQSPPRPRPAPRLGEHTGSIEAREARSEATGSSSAEEAGRPLPLNGLRVLDLTAWWAGPSASHMLATLGAEVIHVESIQRPDGMRTTGGMMKGRVEDWWEYSAFFLSANTNKRGITLDLTRPRGVEIAKKLVAHSDVLIENFTPRVIENFGLDWPTVHALNPRTIMVRMPAFGLSGPWRDNTGFAQTMEQMTGLAWVTGHRDDQPRIQRGPCDPLAGMHATFALLVALEEREASGRGSHVECTMVEGALNAAAEQLIEFTAYGALMQRDGNRCPEAAPQGLYPCRGSEPGRERWLALSVASDAHWAALQRVMGHPGWARDAAYASLAGRRAAHDAIDAGLRPWIAERERDALIAELVAAGVPAGQVWNPRESSLHPQIAARGFYEEVRHPVAGVQPIPSVPFRYASVERWVRSPAPTLGQHNREVLQELGIPDPEIEALAAEGVIGQRPEGA
ncbi:MAG: CoA transferase [Deltaproteobacteria bacterium]|nr:CoA transferase [Deltaproteobacteria bacterium]